MNTRCVTMASVQTSVHQCVLQTRRHPVTSTSVSHVSAVELTRTVELLSAAVSLSGISLVLHTYFTLKVFFQHKRNQARQTKRIIGLNWIMTELKES